MPSPTAPVLPVRVDVSVEDDLPQIPSPRNESDAMPTLLGKSDSDKENSKRWSYMGPSSTDMTEASVDKMPSRIESTTSSMDVLYSQLMSIQKHLKFGMVAKEGGGEKALPASSAIACSCQVLLIRDVDPINATFHCRFNVFLEWLDPVAVGLPKGVIAKDNRKGLNIPELGLQNALFAGKEVHSDPEVVVSETGHVAIKIMFQAAMQMDLDMRLFPFDAQQLPLILGLRARKDRHRVLCCQFCHIDPQIRLDEWSILGPYGHSDRENGRARVQFGVVIGRAYWYYVVNVLLTLIVITLLLFLGYLLPSDDLFDRLRFGIAVLFAQTTFRLSIENKLPKVSYATAFDQYSMGCQLIVLAIISGNVATALLSRINDDLYGFCAFLDVALLSVFSTLYVLANVVWLRSILRSRKAKYKSLCLSFLDEGKTQKPMSAEATDIQDATPQALQQLATITDNIHYTGNAKMRERNRRVQTVLRAVSIAAKVWLIHDVDEIASTFESKFDLYLEWLDDKAIGLPEGQQLTDQQRQQLDIPDCAIHNAVDVNVIEEPKVTVLCGERGRVLMRCTYYARLQLHLNLRRFPFDEQRLPIVIAMNDDKDQTRAFIQRTSTLSEVCRDLDEWIIDGNEIQSKFSKGASQARFEVTIRRRSRFYAVSVLAVLFALSSLVFTLFVVDVDVPKFFTHQGKIFMPVLMALLAFKLSYAGKLPKVAHSTILDRYVIYSQLLFLLVAVACAITKLLISSGFTHNTATQSRNLLAFTIASGWIAGNIWLVFEVQLGGGDAKDQAVGDLDDVRVAQFFEMQRCSLLNDRNLSCSEAESCSVVLLNICMKHIHSVNPMKATFHCEFTATMFWFDEVAMGLPTGTRLPCGGATPNLMVRNAVHADVSQLDGGTKVLCPDTGCVMLKLKFQCAVQMQFMLELFPFDAQALAVCLSLPSPTDQHRRLVLEKCEDVDAVCVGEWSVLRTFSSDGTVEGLSCASFGVVIKRSSRYYVIHMLSTCLYTTFALHVYGLEVRNFADRAKILMGVLLVQVVSKLSVSGKLPRVARITVFDNCALGCFAFLLGLAVSTSVCSIMANTKLFDARESLLEAVDYCLGLTLTVTWLFRNLRLTHSVWKVHHSGLRVEARTDVDEFLPVDLVNVQQQLDKLRNFASQRGVSTTSNRSSGSGRNTLSLVQNSLSSQASRSNASHLEVVAPESHMNNRFLSRLSQAWLANEAVAVGTKIWLVSDVDVAVSTFDCKFHVFLDWLDEKAIGMEDGMRVDAKSTKSTEKPLLEPPRITVQDAICIFNEDHSELEVKDGEIGHVSCRIQYHVRVHGKFDLKSFPFDCQRLDVTLCLEPRIHRSGRTIERPFIESFCEIDDQNSNLDGWKLIHISMGHSVSKGPSKASICMIIEREWMFYIQNVLVVLGFFGTLVVFFFLLENFSERIVDLLKIVLSQTAFRFSVEHRLPKVSHWTPFDIYAVSCKLVFLVTSLSFLSTQSGDCDARQRDTLQFKILLAVWTSWNVLFAMYCFRVRRREKNRTISSMLPPLPEPVHYSPEDEEGVEPISPISTESLNTMRQTLRGPRPWEVEAHMASSSTLKQQLISIAFRIWLVRNIDPVRGTFDCKFRVFLEWLDDSAKGLEKGKKIKTISIPNITIANAVNFRILDQSSAPEVVNSTTGHLAVQILYRATLKMDQQVQSFPFDVQWLAITMSLRDGVGLNRSFLYQYCEVDGQLKLDEWSVHSQPTYSTITKHAAQSIQDTVNCGMLVRRYSRYYAVNILMMLGLICTCTFAIYCIDIKSFWERAEVFLGIFPLIVTFKMSAQGKLPRVGYMTAFDRYAMNCQYFFFLIVTGAMIASFPSTPIWPSAQLCDLDIYSADTTGDDVTLMYMQNAEWTFAIAVGFMWVVWNLRFTLRARNQLKLHPLDALRASVRPSLQDDALDTWCSHQDFAEQNQTCIRGRLSSVAPVGLTSGEDQGLPAHLSENSAFSWSKRGLKACSQV